MPWVTERNEAESTTWRHARVGELPVLWIGGLCGDIMRFAVCLRDAVALRGAGDVHPVALGGVGDHVMGYRMRQSAPRGVMLGLEAYNALGGLWGDSYRGLQRAYVKAVALCRSKGAHPVEFGGVGYGTEDLRGCSSGH